MRDVFGGNKSDSFKHAVERKPGSAATTDIKKQIESARPSAGNVDFMKEAIAYEVDRHITGNYHVWNQPPAFTNWSDDPAERMMQQTFVNKFEAKSAAGDFAGYENVRASGFGFKDVEMVDLITEEVLTSSGASEAMGFQARNRAGMLEMTPQQRAASSGLSDAVGDVVKETVEEKKDDFAVQQAETRAGILQPESIMDPIIQPSTTRPPKPSRFPKLPKPQWPTGLRPRSGGRKPPDEPDDPDDEDDDDPWGDDEDPHEPDPDADEEMPELDLDADVDFPEPEDEIPPFEVESQERPQGSGGRRLPSVPAIGDMTPAQRAAAALAAGIAAAGGIGGAVAAESGGDPVFDPAKGGGTANPDQDNHPTPKSGDPETRDPQMPPDEKDRGGGRGRSTHPKDPRQPKMPTKDVGVDPRQPAQPTSPAKTPFDQPTDAPTDAPTAAPTAAPVAGVTEKLIAAKTAGLTEDIHPDSFKHVSLLSTLQVEGGDDVAQSPEDVRINERRIMDEIVMANTEWEDRKNILKIQEARNNALRYWKTRVRNPVYVGDPGNFIKISKFSRPSAHVKRKLVHRNVSYMSNPGQRQRENQYSNVFKPNNVTAGIYGDFPFHSIYSNMNMPSINDHSFVF